jgi:predicted transcriptional regulator of viral defense system
MNVGFIRFKEALYVQGIFSTDHIRQYFPTFNSDNLLQWQQKGYIVKLRNKWYCFKEFLAIPDSHYLIANEIYSPSYVSHQQALMFYGLIPEHIVDSISVTTKKTNSFEILQRSYKYYSVKRELFFGYRLMPINVNGIMRSIKIAEKEKAILDLLYLYSFYKTAVDIEDLRLNEPVMENEIDWPKLTAYTKRFNSKTLSSKVDILIKIFKHD